MSPDAMRPTYMLGSIFKSAPTPSELVEVFANSLVDERDPSVMFARACSDAGTLGFRMCTAPPSELGLTEVAKKILERWYSIDDYAKQKTIVRDLQAQPSSRYELSATFDAQMSEAVVVRVLSALGAPLEVLSRFRVSDMNIVERNHFKLASGPAFRLDAAVRFPLLGADLIQLRTEYAEGVVSEDFNGMIFSDRYYPPKHLGCWQGTRICCFQGILTDKALSLGSATPVGVYHGEVGQPLMVERGGVIN